VTLLFKIVFIDLEVNPHDNRVLDFGAIKSDNSKLHSTSQNDFLNFIKEADFICGHNIISHDLKYIGHLIKNKNTTSYIDTLYLSPLLFPTKPYHALLKDDKFETDELNNPLNDAIKARDLFFAEINAFEELYPDMKDIYFALLHTQPQFSGFFKYMDYFSNVNIEMLIKSAFSGKICTNAKIGLMIEKNPLELAYCLALINTNDRYSITPPWVTQKYIAVSNIMKFLRNSPCSDKCEYCRNFLDMTKRLKSIFGYERFRSYDGEPLQEDAAVAAINNRSLVAIFPTGGGKSITFQLPALVTGEVSRGLTVVISPLQSLMKDQVDNLVEFDIVDAVYINGLLNVIERAEAIERVVNGLASILYISPEQLRSKTIEKLLLSRNLVRFVIDEAHCFSSWGHDFRVDYLYIGDFINELQKKKNMLRPIPVSCFTATAKQKVIIDIQEYFKEKLDIELELFATNATRKNLQYKVLYKEDDEKYLTLRNLISAKECPTIVYVSRTKKSNEIAKQLSDDGFPARAFNGKMDTNDKITNQEAFMSGDIRIIVATSAFGMGVDKKDVGLVIHYDISDSLENYVQEAGRAGRNEDIQADCYVLFNDNDLNKHFILLNQTKLSISEIGQVWRAIKELTRTRKTIYRSPLEIARQAGWDDNVLDIETRVKTAVSALEKAGYIKRGMNAPQVFATSILAKTMAEASKIINTSSRFDDEKDRQYASRIIKSLIGSRSIANAGNADAESRVDYIADREGIEKADVIASINLMREEGLLADSKDLTAFIRKNENENKSLTILNQYIQLEKLLMDNIKGEISQFNLKELNEQAENAGIKKSSVKMIKSLLYYWTIKQYIKKSFDSSGKNVEIIPQISVEAFEKKYLKRIDLAEYIVKFLFTRCLTMSGSEKEELAVEFSVLELLRSYTDELSLIIDRKDTTGKDVEDALLYLAKTESLSLEGGFLVLYQAIQIDRLELNNLIKYKEKDYQYLNEYYQQKIQQIHIIGEYANMMVKDYNESLQFVSDYFQMDYKHFIDKYFKGNRKSEISRNITTAKYKKLFGGLSAIQKEIIDDEKSKYIVVTAGPGSGKTKLLVHKLAALYQLEDVKHEQMLMLTFSRAAVSEFKSRLANLIDGAAYYIDIMTFHSYCFDLLGKIGKPDDFDNIVKSAIEMIKNEATENKNITKTVLVIDEAQDINDAEFELINTLMDKNEDMKVIAVGDDDQNIFEFRGASSQFMKTLIEKNETTKYDLLDNYRSKNNIVEFANEFAKTFSERMKDEYIKAVQSDNGIIKLIKHVGKNMEEALVNSVKANLKDISTCVLTYTNDEAVRVAGLLSVMGFNAKLIQESKELNLYNIVEIRFFIDIVNKQGQSATISDEIWNLAIRHLMVTFQKSDCLSHCLRIINKFAEENEQKYKTDFEMFIKESKYEDFYQHNQGEILVSTIHKAKGREFESVYLMLNNIRFDKEEQKRNVYVAITRAKSELYIHYNNKCLDNIHAENVERFVDTAHYTEPEEIRVQLMHGDVILSFFKDKEEEILALRSGDELLIKGNELYTVNQRKIVCFSQKFKQEIVKLNTKGYQAIEAKVRFVVYWKGKDEKREVAIILPDIVFRKCNS